MLSVASALTSSSAAFAGAAAPAVAQRSAARVAPAMGAKSVDEMIGKYSVKDTVFDPLNLAESYDINWLREAELKHGRVCMLGVVGFLAVDGGVRFPGDVFQGMSAVEAHDTMVTTGHMWALLAAVGALEFWHLLKIAPLLDTEWEGVEPGNYLSMGMGFYDPLKMDTPARRMAELKNGRLAMLGFSGLVTQAALGTPGYWA